MWAGRTRERDEDREREEDRTMEQLYVVSSVTLCLLALCIIIHGCILVCMRMLVCAPDFRLTLSYSLRMRVQSVYNLGPACVSVSSPIISGKTQTDFKLRAGLANFGRTLVAAVIRAPCVLSLVSTRCCCVGAMCASLPTRPTTTLYLHFPDYMPQNKQNKKQYTE